LVALASVLAFVTTQVPLLIDTMLARGLLFVSAVSCRHRPRGLRLTGRSNVGELGRGGGDRAEVLVWPNAGGEEHAGDLAVATTAPHASRSSCAFRKPRG
jgi:hypothetical protein